MSAFNGGQFIDQWLRAVGFIPMWGMHEDVVLGALIHSKELGFRGEHVLGDAYRIPTDELVFKDPHNPGQLFTHRGEPVEVSSGGQPSRDARGKPKLKPDASKSHRATTPGHEALGEVYYRTWLFKRSIEARGRTPTHKELNEYFFEQLADYADAYLPGGRHDLSPGL